MSFARLRRVVFSVGVVALLGSLAVPAHAVTIDWVTGVLVGWVAVRLVVCWPVSWDVVVAVDMKWFLFWFVKGGWARGDDSLSPLIRP